MQLKLLMSVYSASSNMHARVCDWILLIYIRAIAKQKIISNSYSNKVLMKTNVIWRYETKNSAHVNSSTFISISIVNNKKTAHFQLPMNELAAFKNIPNPFNSMMTEMRQLIRKFTEWTNADYFILHVGIFI